VGNDASSSLLSSVAAMRARGRREGDREARVRPRLLRRCLTLRQAVEQPVTARAQGWQFLGVRRVTELVDPLAATLPLGGGHGGRASGEHEILIASPLVAAGAAPPRHLGGRGQLRPRLSPVAVEGVRRARMSGGGRRGSSLASRWEGSEGSVASMVARWEGSAGSAPSMGVWERGEYGLCGVDRECGCEGNRGGARGSERLFFPMF
jgi:hypothetical protein